MTIKLNLGSGSDKREGYINVDSNKQFKPDKIGDVRKLSFKDNYADEILARDILEHIPISECQKTLLEWKRILKPGGKLIIQVPNLDTISRGLRNKKTNVIKRFDLIKRIFGGQDYSGNFHQNGFTPGTMEICLKSALFKYIKINPIEDLKDPTYPYNLVARCIK